MKNIFFITAILLIASGSKAIAQNRKAQPDLPVFNTSGGPVLFFGGSSINSSGNDSKGTKYTLSRTEQNTAGTKVLTLPGMATSFSSFKKISGDIIIQELKRQLKTATDDAMWQYIRQHPDLTAYGLISLSTSFRLAMGSAFIDEEVKDKKGKTFVYKMDQNGSAQNTRSFSATITIGQSPDFTAPVMSQSKATDSLVYIRWKAKVKKDIPYFAWVYRQTGDRGAFQKLPVRILVNRKNDSAYYLFNEKVNANSAYRYFIRPADLLENEGSFNSDTVNLVAANFNKLPMVTQLKATDTLNGILLSWKQLPANPLITGIEIQRSRDSRGDYVIMDSVNASATTYRDLRLLPHVAYYYRLRVLNAGPGQKRAPFYTSVSADKQKTTHIPDAPYGVTVSAVSKGVRVSWQNVNDPDLYAYYVYRGSSLESKMEVISPSLRDTVYTDTASNLSRQLNYVYAVKAVSNAARESAFSEKIAAHLKGTERPRTPGGIRTIRQDNRLVVQWEDVKRNDPAIMGYILYKHKTDGKPLTYSVNNPASVEATRLGLELVVPALIKVPYYEDSVSSVNNKYEYLVSAVDQFGAESGLSATASSPNQQAQSIKGPAQLYIRSVKDGISLEWEMADAIPVQSYSVYRRTMSAKTSSKIAVVQHADSQFTDKQVTPGNVYVYYVTATTSNGESVPSMEKSIRK
jgi:fibronectin type 3 domain-containing protein